VRIIALTSLSDLRNERCSFILVSCQRNGVIRRGIDQIGIVARNAVRNDMVGRVDRSIKDGINQRLFVECEIERLSYLQIVERRIEEVHAEIFYRQLGYGMEV